MKNEFEVEEIEELILIAVKIHKRIKNLPKTHNLQRLAVFLYSTVGQLSNSNNAKHLKTEAEKRKVKNCLDHDKTVELVEKFLLFAVIANGTDLHRSIQNFLDKENQKRSKIEEKKTKFKATKNQMKNEFEVEEIEELVLIAVKIHKTIKNLPENHNLQRLAVFLYSTVGQLSNSNNAKHLKTEAEKRKIKNCLDHDKTVELVEKFLLFAVIANGTDLHRSIQNFLDKENRKKAKIKQPRFTCPVCIEGFLVEDGTICCTAFENIKANDKIERHNICIDCIRGIAKAALTDTLLAANGIGLPCCVLECKNVFLMSEFGIYLDPEIHYKLMLRMQHESILAANMDDLLTCPSCSTMICVDQRLPFYKCTCGVRKCRHCPRLYDKAHSDKTCKEMDKLDLRNKIETSLSEVVVRKCPKCFLQFVKESGCNKMTCRCGTLQCYLCRAVVKDYTHFCHCGTKEFDKPCPRCFKTCPLMGDANQYDEQRLKQVRKDNGFLN